MKLRQLLPIFIQGGGSLDNLINYSTNEVEIGKWFDGSSLYRKVIQVGEIAANTIIDIDVQTTIKEMINFYGLLFDDYGIGYPLNYNNIYTKDIDIGAFYYKISNEINLYTYGDFSIKKGYIIIEYTK